MKRKRNEGNANPKKKRTKRSVKKHLDIKVRGTNGELRDATFKDSTWHTLYIDTPPTTERRKKIFRRRFRLPYEVYLEMVDDVKNHELFTRWTHKDCIGVPPSDIGLLLLGVLRYLGRSLTYDDLEEFTFISSEVHQQFLLHFLNMAIQSCIINML